MQRVTCTSQLVLLRHPYLVVGAGFDVPTGVPRALKSPRARLWWQRDGEGTAFRIGRSPDIKDWFAVVVWWAQSESDLPEFPDEPTASGRNTVDLRGPAEGTFSIHGSNGDIWPIMIQLEDPVVTYSWAIRVRRLPPGSTDEEQLVELLTLVFE